MQDVAFTEQMLLDTPVEYHGSPWQNELCSYWTNPPPLPDLQTARVLFICLNLHSATVQQSFVQQLWAMQRYLESISM